VPHISGWVGGRRVGRVERVGGLTMLLVTSDQIVCTVGQTDGHSSPDHTMSCADVQWDRIGPGKLNKNHSQSLTHNKLPVIEALV